MKSIFLLAALASSSVEAFAPPHSVQQCKQYGIRDERTVAALHLFDTSLHDTFVNHIASSSLTLSEFGPPEAGGVSYSRASYFTILGLYLMSFPGVWSTIKRSTKAKVKRKTFVTKGENASTGTGKTLREEAGGIMACK